MRCAVPLSIALLCLTGCASTAADHFYALEPQPAAGAYAQPGLATPVSLNVTVPSLVDRNEWVLRDGTGVTVLEHERWAAPLADQVTNVLGRNIEQRRPDVMISTRRLSQAGGAKIAISVDIVELSISRGSGVYLETRWRIERGGGAQAISGRDRFKQPAAGGEYALLAGALSACVAQLADRMAQQLPPPANASN